MSKHHVEHVSEHGKSMINHAGDHKVEKAKHDDGGSLGWAEREAMECWKGGCKAVASTAKTVQEACKTGKENFDKQPEWAKILEFGTVAGLVCAGVGRQAAAVEAEANQSLQTSLRRQGTEEVSSTLTKHISGETHVEQQIKYGDGTKTSVLLDPQSAAGKKAMQNGMSGWARDHHQH